jgi:ribonuclease BN (tRNA processing enzyme)
MVLVPDSGDISLIVLGCDGSWPGPDGAGSSYLIRIDDLAVLLDCGPGTAGPLQSHIDPGELSAVVISHHHADHWSDLYALDAQARFGRSVRHRGRPLPVYAPAAVRDRVGADEVPSVEWHVVTDGDRASIGDLALAFHRTDHVDETLAVRIDGGGRALGYSADTGPGWAPSALGLGLDLLLCEATFTADHEGTAQHLSGRQAGQAARDAEVARLIITHRWPSASASAVLAEAEAAYGGPVEQAVRGNHYEL